MSHPDEVPRLTPGAPPIGRRVRVNSTWSTVVAVVKDSKYFSVAEASRPFLYSPFRQRAGWDEQLYMFLRTDSAPEQAAAALRRAVADIDPNAGAFYPIPLAQWTEITMIPQKMASGMLTGMGLVSLLLAAIGLYSVMAYSMNQRTHEIGVRMALGAMPGDVIRMALRQGLGMTVPGLAIGLTAALAGSRVVSSMLVNVSGADPITFAAVPLFLGSIAILACVVPAWRAIRLDPMSALHTE